MSVADHPGACRLATIDLGASNGRVILGVIAGGKISLQVVHRFDHRPLSVEGRLRWDWPRLVAETRSGLLEALRAAGGRGLDAISCSSWAQDFGLLDRTDHLFYTPVCYRDARTRGMPASFADLVPTDELLARTGCGVSPVTALCQLRAMSLDEPDNLARAGRLLFVADLMHWTLCGACRTDWTMATASQMRRLPGGQWDHDLLACLGVPSHFLPEVGDFPEIIGRVQPSFAPELAGIPVISTAGHDTAAASLCGEAIAPDAFFLCLGTWAMLGCRTAAPAVFGAAADRRLFILGLPERGWAVFKAGGGLWLLQECRRRWAADGHSLDDARCVEEARASTIRGRIDPMHDRFHAPADMPAEIVRACLQAGREAPSTPGEFARIIFESLAEHYAGALRDLERASATRVGSLVILGGGSRNRLLCDLIRDRAGVPVLEGPAEATTLGNMLLQARVLGAVDREDLPALVRDHVAGG
jgi:sugar (pentulose or hexulose) kinase